MANRIYIEQTIFTNYRDMSKTYGYRMYDDYGSVYNNTMDQKSFMAASDLDILKYAYQTVGPVGSDMFQDAEMNDKSIYVNDAMFTSKDWKGDPDE